MKNIFTASRDLYIQHFMIRICWTKYGVQLNNNMLKRRIVTVKQFESLLHLISCYVKKRNGCDHRRVWSYLDRFGRIQNSQSLNPSRFLHTRRPQWFYSSNTTQVWSALLFRRYWFTLEPCYVSNKKKNLDIQY